MADVIIKGMETYSFHIDHKCVGTSTEGIYLQIRGEKANI